MCFVSTSRIEYFAFRVVSLLYIDARLNCYDKDAGRDSGRVTITYDIELFGRRIGLYEFAKLFSTERNLNRVDAAGRNE